ncbi:MAG: hypothetical protein ACLSB9_14005, partial [Hydrogeniiclostridium mannosilyticum]
GPLFCSVYPVESLDTRFTCGALFLSMVLRPRLQRVFFVSASQRKSPEILDIRISGLFLIRYKIIISRKTA